MKKYISLLLVIFTALYSCKKEDEKSRAKPETGDNRTFTDYLAAQDWPPSGIKQQVEVDQENTAAKNYYIIFDGSGSMDGEKLVIAKKAFVQFINNVPDGANIGLVCFDASGFYERAPLGSPKKEIIDKVNKIRAGGNTPLGGCINIAYEKLGLQAKRQLGYGEYNLIILTDGEATDKGMGQAVERILSETPIVIHTIGLKIGQGHALNQTGRIYYRAAENLKDVSSGLESVLAETEDFTVTDF